MTTSLSQRLRACLRFNEPNTTESELEALARLAADKLDSIRIQIEEDINRMLKHITLGNDIRDFSDDIDSILGVVGSDKTTEDFVDKNIAYWLNS